MHELLILVVFLVSILSSWLLTSRVRQFALSKDLLDIPNERSSHESPTPRGGGLAIVVVTLLSCCLLFLLPGADTRQILCIFFVVLAFAVLGWQDDRHDLSALSRLLVQLVIAVICTAYLVWTGSVFFHWSGLTGIVVLVCMVLWITWLANLYNFMDGIDGISGVETVVLAMTTSWWFASNGAFSLAVLSISVAGAALGFLRWNWAPAKIFMGDVGSLSLGGLFAILAILGVGSAGLPAAAFLILYGVYLADATITLLRRMIRGERWWAAHRSHHYQRAVQSGYSHAQVSLAVFIINIVLAFIASLVVAGLLSVYAGLLVSAIILATIMFLINFRYTRTQIE